VEYFKKLFDEFFHEVHVEARNVKFITRAG